MPEAKKMLTPKNKLTLEGYRPRIVEGRLDALMAAFGCVEMIGPKWCGKTWTCLSRAASVSHLDREAERSAAEVDPRLALAGDTPHLIDEWQEVPEVWDAVRSHVDEAHGTGLVLLTGSVALSKKKRSRVHHSGAGRIARLRMHPMTLFEQGVSTGAIRLSGLLAGDGIPIPVRQEGTVGEVAEWCCRGGWPATLGLPLEVALETPLQYIQASLDVNVIEEGRSPATALALMRALALNAGQAATAKTLRTDMADFGVSLGEVGLESYLELLERLYLIEELRGWEPPLRSKARVRVKPKRYFADPSLAAALLGATPEGLAHDMQTLGLLFETLCARELWACLSTYRGLGNGLHYYRDEKGLEVDFIVELGGHWAGIECKLSDAKVDEAAANLLRLKRKVTANPAARNAEPSFLGVLVGSGTLAYQRPDGVCVIPVATLAP